MDRLPEYKFNSKLLKDYYNLKWLFTGENHDYIAPEFLALTELEVEKIKLATTESYKMLWDACKYVIENNLWKEVGVPQNAVEAVKHSWNRQHPYLFGRIDFAGGVGNIPLKLLEFNGDVATLLPEAVDAQDMIFKNYAPQNAQQFNNIRDSISQTLLRQKAHLTAGVLATSFGYDEDIQNANCILQAAAKAGYDVLYKNLEELIFDPEEGVMVESGEEYTVYPNLFKVIPWEIIADEEPELMQLLTELTVSDRLKVINPAYAMVLQSKGLLPIMNRLYPNHPLLLETHYDAAHFNGRKYIKKVIYGRLGENIELYNEWGRVEHKTRGDFGHYPSIYQEIADFFRDEDNCHYQISSFVTPDACIGIGIRRQDELIINEDAEFVPHYYMG